MANKIDRLFALKALEQRIAEERKLLEYECRDELLEAFEQDGTDRRVSPYFGPEAGKFSVKHYRERPGQEVVTYELEDWHEFSAWLDSDPKAAADFAFAKAELFAEWWTGRTGELPGGVSRKVAYEEGKPAYDSAQVYSFKPDLVLERLAECGNVFEGANRLLMEGDGE